MKKVRIYLVVLLILAVLPVPLSSSYCAQETVDKVAAVVNNRVITVRELNAEIQKAYPDSPKAGPADKAKDNMRAVLDEMISEILIEEEIKTKGMEVSEQELGMFIRNVMEQNRIHNMSDFVSALSLQGMTLEAYKESLKKQIQKTKIMNYAVRSKVNISDQDLKNQYMKNMDEMRGPDTIHLKNIFIPASGKGRNRDEAQKILQSLNSGASFESLAKKHSKDANAKSGGDLGYMTAKDLNPSIYNAVKDIKPGRFSKIIDTPKGYYIFKVVEKKTGSVMDFEEIKEDLKAKMTNDEMEKHFKSWLSELKSRSYIDIKIQI